ncbi:MAG: hypothetical protein KIS66_03990 [Fimbriimonadaceae bacterium]|nr:hypothetical protein [Fimbriimonadaceae bacterium]
MHYVYWLSFGHTEYDQSRYTIWTTGSPTGNAGIYCEAWVRSGEKFDHQGLGWFSFAQLDTVDRTQWNGAGVPLHTDCPIGSLDNCWPYATSGGTPSWWPADDTELSQGTKGDTTDCPEWELIMGTATFGVNDDFEMLLIYEPPSNGVGTEIVPLHVAGWNWSAEGSRSLGNVVTFSVNSIAQTSSVKTPSWSLQWTNVHLNN